MSNKKVTIYSTPTCHFCHTAKEFFKQNQVAYTEHDVQSNMEKRQEMMDKTGQMGVPVIALVDENGQEEFVVGFDQGTLIELLGL